MSLILMGSLTPFGLSSTEEIEVTMVSFCISMCRSQSAKNSKNSQRTPMVMEKQKATMERKNGDRWKAMVSSRLSRSTSEKPTAAIKNPVVVCSMASQKGTFVKKEEISPRISAAKIKQKTMLRSRGGKSSPRRSPKNPGTAKRTSVSRPMKTFS